jgi:ubiquitin-protein ligase
VGDLKLRTRTVEQELHELQGVFPSLTRDDFFYLENGNICVQVKYVTTGPYACGRFHVLIEFPHTYPTAPPRAWVIEPKLSYKTHHVHKTDKYGHTEICYLRPQKDWHYSYTAYDAAIMIQTWIWAYCRWRKTGSWDWREA